VYLHSLGQFSFSKARRISHQEWTANATKFQISNRFRAARWDDFVETEASHFSLAFFCAELSWSRRILATPARPGSCNRAVA